MFPSKTQHPRHSSDGWGVGIGPPHGDIKLAKRGFDVIITYHSKTEPRTRSERIKGSAGMRSPNFFFILMDTTEVGSSKPCGLEQRAGSVDKKNPSL